MIKAIELKAEDMHLLPARNSEGNKADFGKVLVIAGSPNMAGAAAFAALAAYRAGAGLVYVFTHELNRNILQTLVPEAVLKTYDSKGFDITTLNSLIDKCDSIVIGPGLGMSENALEMLRYLLFSIEKPMIIDADALNIISVNYGLDECLKPNMVITPHIKEFSRLTRWSIEEIKADAAAKTLEYAKRRETTLVLKDADTFIADAEGHLFVNKLGNSGMATGGSGDVLSGIIGAFLALPGVSPINAARCGVLLHALSGDRAANERSERSMIARDIIECIR